MYVCMNVFMCVCKCVCVVYVYIGVLGELVWLVRHLVTGRSASSHLRCRFVMRVRACEQAGKAKLCERMWHDIPLAGAPGWKPGRVRWPLVLSSCCYTRGF